MDYFVNFKAVCPIWSMLTHGAMERHGVFVEEDKICFRDQYKSDLDAFFKEFSCEGMRDLQHTDTTNNTSELTFSLIGFCI